LGSADCSKSIVSSACVVADLASEPRRFLAHDAGGGSEIVDDISRATRHETRASARRMLDAWMGEDHRQVAGLGDWRVWEVTTWSTFTEAH
jgi:hypothetical protein